ncbi:MAG: Fe(2+)-trafficking protein [Acidobacteriota bacterium]
MILTVNCRRCAEKTPALETPPLGVANAQEIQEKACAACWEEWRLMEVRVINELKLNFMDPESEKKLSEHMRDFLKLD